VCILILDKIHNLLSHNFCNFDFWKWLVCKSESEILVKKSALLFTKYEWMSIGLLNVLHVHFFLQNLIFSVHLFCSCQVLRHPLCVGICSLTAKTWVQWILTVLLSHQWTLPFKPLGESLWMKENYVRLGTHEWEHVKRS